MGVGVAGFMAKFLKDNTMSSAFVLAQVLGGKKIPKIWCNKTEPKKSYEGSKLRFVHFCWVFRYMDTLEARKGRKNKKLKLGGNCNRYATQIRKILYSQVYRYFPFYW